MIGRLLDAFSEAGDAQRADLQEVLHHLDRSNEFWRDYSLLTPGGWLLGSPVNWGAPAVQTLVPTTLWLTRPLADSVKPTMTEPVIEDGDNELDDGLHVKAATSGGQSVPTPPSPPAVPLAGTK